ncbi:GATA transcription factor 16, partial [Mucuna pruriens]
MLIPSRNQIGFLGIESQISEIRMVDPSGKVSVGVGSEAAEDSNPNAPSSGSEQKKTCADCGTTKTPLWRGGPAGPKSLCNACGIRSRKKKRAILGISKGSTDDVRKGKRNINNNNSNSNANGGPALRREVLLHRSHWKKLGEEEKAAVLLMSLSYGSVYA